MKIRKQVYELTVADFERNAVWEFALDEEGVEGQDEATVRPYPIQGPLDPSEGMFVLRAKFKLRDGSEFIGYVTACEDASDLGTIQPQIITPDGQVIFWMGSVRDDVAPLYQRLGKTAEQVFPIDFTSDVPLTSGALIGRISAFLHLKDFRTGLIDEVK